MESHGNRYKSTDLSAAQGIFHQDWRHDSTGIDLLDLLPQLRKLKQGVLVKVDPPLQDPQQRIQRVVGQRRLDDVQQRLVLDEPLLDLVLLQREQALVARLDRRRAVGDGPREDRLVRQGELLELLQRRLVRVDRLLELDLHRVVEVHQGLVRGADEPVLAHALEGLVEAALLVGEHLPQLRVREADDLQT